MERTLHTSRFVLLAASLIFLVSGCGKPWVYHVEHYDGPFDVIAQSNKTYFHSPKTGKIIPKEECRNYCEPPCYGYEPTTWTHWPTHCPGKFPVQGEVFVEPVEGAGDFSYSYEDEGVQPESVMYDSGSYQDDEPEIVLPPPAQMPVNPVTPGDPTNGLEDPIIVPEDALEEQVPASPSVTIPSDLESSSPSPSDGADNLTPELPSSPVRLAPPSTKIPVDGPMSKGTVKDPTVQLVEPIKPKSRLIQAVGYGPMIYAPVKSKSAANTEDTKQGSEFGKPSADDDTKEQMLVKRSITAKPEYAKVEPSVKSSAGKAETEDGEVAVRKIERTPDNDIVVTVAANETPSQETVSPIPSVAPSVVDEIATASSKLQAIRIARGESVARQPLPRPESFESHSLSNKLMTVREAAPATPTVGWQTPTAGTSTQKLEKTADASEAFPVRPVSHTMLRNSAPDKQPAASKRLQQVQQTSGATSSNEKGKTVRRAILSDELFATDKLDQPKKLRVDRSAISPSKLRPALQPMTPSGLPLAKKVMPRKQAKTNSKPIEAARMQTQKPSKTTLSNKTATAKPVSPPAEEKPVRATKPASEVIAKLEAPAKKVTKARSQLSKQIVVRQPNLRTKTSVKKAIVKPEVVTPPKGIVTANPLAARSLPNPSSLRAIPRTSLPFDASTQSQMLGSQVSQPILSTKSARLAKPAVSTSKSQVAKSPAKPKAMLGFSKSQRPAAKSVAAEKPAAIVSVTVSDEGNGMLQFAKDPPKREVRISSLPDSGPAVRFR